MKDNALSEILQATRIIAVVGLSNDTSRPSYGVARYLQQQGYQIVPIHPKEQEVLGERAYPDLLSVPFDVDMVDIFRRSEFVGPHIDEAIQKGAKTVWLQFDIHNAKAEQRARDAGLNVVVDRCTKIAHMRLIS
jgi:hypothetical protein